MLVIGRPSTRLLAAALALLAVAAALLIAGAGSALACERAGADPDKTSLKKIEKATLCLVNDRREKHGARSLDRHSKLDDSSAGHSRDMERSNFFSHTGPGGVSLADRVRRTGYLSGSTDWILGENIAWGSGSRAEPKSIVKAWMKSPGHRANILHGSFRDLGVGVVRGGPVGGTRGAATYTTDFGDH